MSLTININGLTLCHKGSNGISNATLPDVCKTPTPGGPVPMPYPNVSMSSDLADGTESVTADGGNKIAIKGSSFSRSTGDEPGTIGGLKSNVNMKASKWILYSFDVKMDGANACRLSDKKTQNGENTVDAQGNVQAPLTPALISACKKADDCTFIDCKNKTQKDGTAWTSCDYKQFCKKLDAVRSQVAGAPGAIEAGQQFVKPLDEDYDVLRAAGNGFAADYKEDWLENVSSMSETEKKAAFYDECAYDQAKQGADIENFSPDHVHEIQHGGSVMGPLKWCSSHVNQSLGGHMKGVKPGKTKKVMDNCCS